MEQILTDCYPKAFTAEVIKSQKVGSMPIPFKSLSDHVFHKRPLSGLPISSGDFWTMPKNHRSETAPSTRQGKRKSLWLKG